MLTCQLAATSRHKFLWNFNQNANIFIQENEFECMCKFQAISTSVHVLHHTHRSDKSIVYQVRCLQTNAAAFHKKKSNTCGLRHVFHMMTSSAKWKHFPLYWPFVRRIHRLPVKSPHKGKWRRALMFSLICALNKRLSTQSWGRWFEPPSRSLWRHYE